MIFVNSQLDDVNALLRIPGLDKSRLKHIKKTLEEGNMLYISDSKFLREQTKEHLENYEGKKLSKYNSADWPELSDREKTTSPKPENNSPTINIAFKFPIVAARNKSIGSSSSQGAKIPGSPAAVYWKTTGNKL